MEERIEGREGVDHTQKYRSWAENETRNIYSSIYFTHNSQEFLGVCERYTANAEFTYELGVR